MLILVLIKSELDQDHILPCTCFENFQVHLQEIMCRFQRTNHDTYLDFFKKFFHAL